MQICQNSNCSNPFNSYGNKFCVTCGSSSLDRVFKNRYTIQRQLGEGGFGKTYEAKDADRLDATCVIKQFRPQLQGTAAFGKATEMFREEAKRLFELGENHNQIPRLIAYFEQGNNLYLVQEFIAGETLLEELQRHLFSEAEIRELLADLLPVLQFVHEHNVIHRDIKPENIIRRHTDKKLVLIDFGGAKQITQTSLARQGTGIYTIGYAPLEQMQGYACEASDLYALGATCARLMTGCLPSQDTYGNLFDSLYDVRNASWLWREHLQEKEIKISDNLGKILDKLLKHLANDRYQSASEVLQALNNSAVSNGSVEKTTISSVPTTIISAQPTSIPQQPTPQSHSLENASLSYVLNGHKNVIRSIIFSSDSQTLFSGANDKTIRIWNLQNRSLQSHLSEPGEWIVLARTLDGKTLASGSSDKTIKIWNLETGRKQNVIKAHSDLINSLSINQEENLLVSCSRDKTIKIWQLDDGKLIKTLSENAGFVYTAKISPDGKFIASGGSDKVIKIWQLDTGLLQKLSGSPGFVRAIAISSSLQILASGGFGTVINLWNLRTGQIQQRLEGHNGMIQTLAISPNGETLISGSDDRTIKIWSLRTGELIKTLSGHNGRIFSIAISPDAKTIASAGEDKTIRIYQ
ncbi:serine/threonine-protein kinase [Rivularia sp. UHCC 0363]|uniref:serine/threonine-protein kinase n=1 Tax=Rivularia sp. UHCC 0363 TaxID=3110244 RepID=UPI002B221077|nr:serine/threonine-protein kinase [Rivularia sp. UHCC 0363]MEA5596168.1 serine/threonine-protein kinase [Rivularia sp. UHCC 0363]